MAFFTLGKNQIANFQKLELPVVGPGDINLLVVYTGTAELNWFRPAGDTQGPDQLSLEIVLEDDFDSLYAIPLAGMPPQPLLPPIPTFLAVSSEFSRTQIGFLPAENNDWDFEIHPSDNQTAFTVLDTVQSGGSHKSVLHILANVANDEGGSFNRIAYQVNVAVRAKAPVPLSPGICGDLAAYRNPPNQPPFNIVLVHDPSNPHAEPNILNPSTLEFFIDPPAPNGANRLLTFTGDAIINFSPSTDDQLTKGTVTIQFLRDLGALSNFVNATGSATLSGIYNNDIDHDTAYAVDCVQVAAGFRGPAVVPMLTAAVVVEGGSGPPITGLSRISYQATVEVLVGLQLLVSAYNPAGPPPNFQRAATVLGGRQWLYQLILPTPGPQAVSVDSANHAVVPPPQSASVPAQTIVFTSSPQPTTPVPPGSSIPVKITASFGAFVAEATLTVVHPA